MEGCEIGGWQGREEEKGGKRRWPQGLVHTPSPKSWKIPWLQNWSNRRGRQHRRLPKPRAATDRQPQKNPLQQEQIWRYGAYDWSYLRISAILAIKSKISLPWRIHCKFEQHIWNHRLEASSRYKNIEYLVHTTGVFTKFTYNKFSLVAMATSLVNFNNTSQIADP